MQDPSVELLKKVQAYDRRSQLELYQLCYPILIGVARRFRKNEEEHKTLVNNAFMKIIQNLDKYQEIRFYSWIKRIVTNEIIDDFRRSKNYHTFYKHDAEIEGNDAVYADVEYEWNQAHLNAMLLQLSEPTRVVFNLFVVDGYSHREIGEMLGISEQTSKWHTKIARKKLKELLKMEGHVINK
ncbi:MAG: RNA polymerase sigma factor [Flavobacteriales bacterium]